MSTIFHDCRLCIDGQLVRQDLIVSSNGNIVSKVDDGPILGRDMKGSIIAPGYLELHTNGVNGFHFTMLDYSDTRGTVYQQRLAQAAKWYMAKGVTGFWATMPTVESALYKKVRIRIGHG